MYNLTVDEAHTQNPKNRIQEPISQTRGAVFVIQHNSVDAENHFVFDSSILSWKGGYIQAVLSEGPHWKEVQEWNCSQNQHLTPWSEERPKFVFEVKPKALYLDNYWTGTNYNLFSSRFIEFLSNLNINLNHLMLKL
jgi:hypothetical protein